MQKAPAKLNNVRFGFQTPMGFFENVEDAVQAVEKVDWSIDLISVVRIGDKEVDHPIYSGGKIIGWQKVTITALSDHDGMELQFH